MSLELANTLLEAFLQVTIVAAILLRFAVKHHHLDALRAQGWVGTSLVRAVEWLRGGFAFRFRFPHSYTVIAALLFLVAILVRVWEFGSVPGGINQDGAMAAVDAKALLDYGTDRLGMKYPVLFTAWGYGQMSVLLSYMMVPFIKLFGLSVTVARIPALLASLAGLLALFLLVRNLWGKGPALFVLGFAAINPWHIMQSRWALDCNILPHMYILGIYFLHRSFTKPILLHVSMFFFALCMYSYGVAFLTLPLFLFAMLLVLLWSRKFKVRQLLLAAGTYVFFAWPVWTTMVINAWKWKTISTPFFTMAFFPESVRSGDILFFVPHKFEQLWRNAGTLAKVILLQGPEPLWNTMDAFGSLYQFSLPFVLLGAVISIKKCLLDRQVSSRYGQILILMALLTGLWAGLVVSQVNVNRMNLVFYPVIILAGIGIWQLFQWIRFLGVFSILLYSGFFIAFCIHYFGDFRRDIALLFHQGLGQAIEVAHKLPFEKLIVTGVGLGNTAEIYTQFHGNMDAHLIQSAEYRQKYEYRNISPDLLNPDGRTVYIAHQDEIASLNLAAFKVLTYPRFSLIVPQALFQNSTLKNMQELPPGMETVDPQKLRGQQDWGRLGINGPADRSGIGFIVQSKGFPHGFGTHGNSQYRYSLSKPYQSLRIQVGISDDVNCGDGVVFRILGDENLLWQSARLKTGELEEAHISVAGVHNLRFETMAGEDNRCDHANWLEPLLTP